MKAHTLLLAFLGLASASQAATTTFSFIADTWTNGSSTQHGYKNGATSGTLTKDGVTMTFTSSFSGTADPSTRNLTLDTTGNPTGFILGTQDDANSLSGSLLHYQRWDFSFSQPVLLTNLGFDDIDSDKTNLTGTDGFRDAIAAEAFTTAVPGAIGSGIDGHFTLTTGTSLIPGVIAAGTGQSLNYVISGPAGNPNNAPAYRAFVDFGSVAVTSFSIYSFSDRDNAHRVSLFQGVIDIIPQPVPEPSIALLGVLGLPLLARRRR